MHWSLQLHLNSRQWQKRVFLCFKPDTGSDKYLRPLDSTVDSTFLEPHLEYRRVVFLSHSVFVMPDELCGCRENLFVCPPQYWSMHPVVSTWLKRTRVCDTARDKERSGCSDFCTVLVLRVLIVHLVDENWEATQECRCIANRSVVSNKLNIQSSWSIVFVSVNHNRLEMAVNCRDAVHLWNNSKWVQQP